MFTDGLDDTAINWIKQKSNAEQPQPRSPLSENIDREYSLPRSPLSGYSSLSSHVLPPLKFRSGILGPPSAVALSVGSTDEDDEENESTASAPDEVEESYNSSEEEGFVNPGELGYNDHAFCSKNNEILNRCTEAGRGSTLTRGLSKEKLLIEVPQLARKFTENELGFHGSGQRSAMSTGSSRLPERFQAHSAYGTPMGMFSDAAEMGTPSAPPIVDNEREDHSSEIGNDICNESVTNDEMGLSKESAAGGSGCKETYSDQKQQSPNMELRERVNGMSTGEADASIPYWQTNSLDNSTHYNTSGQSAWQTLLAYDACIRLCLNAWARGCMEAPEFLHNECVLLRTAFGLHNFLLQPRGKQTTERTETGEQAALLKVKKVVGKIRVEVRKLRIITRRKLKSTYSLRGAMYMQAGAEYVRHVSSLVKIGINSLRNNTSFPITPGEQLPCLIHLKSSTEDTQEQPGSSISLRPGSGDYHDFYPESQGDALLLEVQDSTKNIQGRAIIPISSITENPNERIRWWPIHHDDNECIGKVQLCIGSTFTFDDTAHMKSGPIVETLAYDILLEASMRSQRFHSRNLWINGPWKWLLNEFAEYYGVSDSYTKLRYLSHVMNVATPTKDCLELVHDLLVPVLKAKNERSLTRQEKSLLLDCKTRVDSLLANVFENYKSLDEKSATGLADVFGRIPEAAAPAVAPAVQVYTLLHDILAQDIQTMLRNYLQTAAKKRCRKHMAETDEFISSNSEGLLIDSITMSTAYLKMKNLCTNISNEIQADIKIHGQHILPSSIDLSSITASVYSTELSKRLRAFLSMWPPSSPLPYVNELLIATGDFERSLESWNISPVEGGLNSNGLYHNYIMVWVQEMELNLLDFCKAEKVAWSGVITNHSTSPFAEEMYEKIKEMLIQYEVVISRWPQYTLVLENAVGNVERAIVKSLEKQYNDILTPLKDSIPKRLGIQVQKLARRQSTASYSIPNQLGTFLNTIKRTLDVLHCRVEENLKLWASYLPENGDKKSNFGEQMNAVTVLLRTKYKNYVQATIVKLVNNTQMNRSVRLQRVLEDTKEADGEAEVRERMQMLNTQLIDSISNLHDVFTSRIFVAICRGFWDKMGQIVLKFLEGRKENRVWYNGSYYALGILDDTFASQMQRLLGNALQDKDLEPPRSITEVRSILSRDATNTNDTSNYLYF